MSLHISQLKIKPSTHHHDYWPRHRPNLGKGRKGKQKNVYEQRRSILANNTVEHKTLMLENSVEGSESRVGEATCSRRIAKTGIASSIHHQDGRVVKALDLSSNGQ